MSQILINFIGGYFTPQTISRLMLSNALINSTASLPHFDMLTSLNYTWLHRQIKFNQNKNIKNAPSKNSLFFSLMQLTALLTITFMFLRSSTILLFNKKLNKKYISLLGSIFELVNANRAHSELAVWHYSLLGLATLMLIFLNTKTSQFFKIIIIYCNQFLNISKHQSQQTTAVNHYHSINSLVLFPLNEIETQNIRQIGQKYLQIYRFVSSFMPLNVALTALMIFAVADPTENSLEVFGNSLQIYWIHSTAIIFMWSSWTFWVCYNAYYIFAYFLLCTKIQHVKYRQEYWRLRRLARDLSIYKIGHTYISAILLTHLIRQDRVFNEIRQLNRFWCRYLSYTALICSSLFCFTLYISTMTKAVWFMKLFFISVSLPPISILIIGTWEGAKPFEDTMKMYHSQAMLLCHYGGINWHIQLKISNTMELISSNRIGYTYITGVTLKNETIYQAMTSTMMLFFLIANATRAN